MLGVNADADVRELRRAYLRAVKLHPPERDALGFARVREAFEALKAATGTPLRSAPVRLQPLPIRAQEAKPERQRESEPEPAPEPEAEPAPQVEPAPQAEPKPARADDAPLDLDRALSALDLLMAGESLPLEDESKVDPREEDSKQAAIRAQRDRGEDQALLLEHRLRAADAWVRLDADDPDAHWLRYDLLRQASAHEQAMDVLREAHEAGHEGFFDELVRTYLHQVSAEEFARHIEGKAHLLLPSLLSRLLAHDLERAAKLLTQAMDEGEARGVEVWPGFVSDALLELLVRSRRVLAAKGIARFMTHQEKLGVIKMAAPEMARWLLVSELAQLPADFPDPFVIELARAVRALDSPALARDAGTALRKLSQRYPEQVAHVRSVLSQHAPGAFRVFAVDLPAPSVARTPGVVMRPRQTRWLGAVLMGLGLSFAFFGWLFFWISRDAQPYVYHPSRMVLRPRAGPLPDATVADGAPADASTPAATLEALDAG